MTIILSVLHPVCLPEGIFLPDGCSSWKGDGAVLNLLILRFLPYCVKMAFLRILRPITHITLKLEEKITATCSIHGIIIEDRNLIPGFPV